MKKYVLLAICILTFAQLNAQITFFKGTWTEALKQSKQTGKPIFIDFYATWCGPCKYLSTEIFTDTEVGKYFNDNFISFKVDAEREEPELVESMNLQAFPTLAFFDQKGDMIMAHIGVLEKEELLKKGNQIINFAKNSARVEKSPNDVKALNDYLEVLRFKNFIQAQKLAKGYLERVTTEELQKPENWNLIRNFSYEYDCREFKYIAENPEFFIENEGFTEYYKTGIKALMVDAVKAKDYSKIELHKIYHLKVYKALGLLKHPEEYYTDLIDIMYYDGIGDEENFFNKSTSWIEKFNLDNPQALCEYVLKIADKVKDPQKLKEAKKYAAKAITLSDDFATNYTFSFLLLKCGEKEEAYKYAIKAKEKCTNPEAIPMLNEYIRSFN